MADQINIMQRFTAPREPGLVSIVLPVYNRERYISEAIESVLRQTYENYELIVIDDGSTDDSIKKVKALSDRFKGRMVLVSQENGGPSAAKNIGIQIATGEYIAFLDSDDFWHPEKLEKQMALFALHAHIAFTYTGYNLVDEKGTVFDECLPDAQFSGDIYKKLWKYRNTISGGTILVEKEKLFMAGLYDLELKGVENLDLRLRLSRLGDVYYLFEPLYYYRKHGDSLSTNSVNMGYYRKRFLKKHFGTSTRSFFYRNIRANFLYNDGMAEFSHQRYAAALPIFLKSLFWNPLHFSSALQAGRCCLGKKINGMISRMKKRIDAAGRCSRS